MNKILFSVIIPTYHRSDLLVKCLNCLAPKVQSFPSEQYEVIVTDDGFETTAEEIIYKYYTWAKWVAGPRKGPAANRNNAAKYAQGKWLVFTDDDCLPDPQWLTAYAEAISTEMSYQVFEGRTYVDRLRQSLAEVAPANESGGYLWSCNFCIQKHLFDSLKGFDERFSIAAMEDVELRQRLKNLGYNFLFIKMASVCHPWRVRHLKKNEWKNFIEYKDAILTYLSIHPSGWEQINYKYYIFSVFRGIIKEIIPGIIQYKFRGVRVSITYNIFFNLYMSYICIFRKLC
jgi:glycosyltransferase involved in cell wall biosynthesis